MKNFLSAAFAALLLFSCQNDPIESTTAETNLEADVSTQKRCATQEVLEEQLKKDPMLAIRMNEIENFTQNRILTNRLVNGKIEIPVVVNVLYRTATENISETQIKSQITVLNKDFNAQNSDYNTVPALFSGLKANVGISFVLEKINRKSSTKRGWLPNDEMKKKSKGGIDATTPTTTLNIWVVNKMTHNGDNLLGYAQFPGNTAATDGVVIAHKYLGDTGVVSAPYNLGRTATHEVGHWMNLRHIWGDALCGSDFVSDTPTHDSYNLGVPTYPHYSTCPGKPVEMTMNYMDYSDDRGLYMFTTGQKNRMTAIFASGGPRASFGI